MLTCVQDQTKAYIADQIVDAGIVAANAFQHAQSSSSAMTQILIGLTTIILSYAHEGSLFGPAVPAIPLPLTTADKKLRL